MVRAEPEKKLRKFVIDLKNLACRVNTIEKCNNFFYVKTDLAYEIVMCIYM